MEATTLDALIARHGRPRFLKLDVEGFEAEAVDGLSVPVPVLSFEFTTIQRAVAARVLDRLAALAPYRFNVALGETHRLAFPEPVDRADLGAWLAELPDEANSGDVYAFHEG